MSLQNFGDPGAACGAGERHRRAGAVVDFWGVVRPIEDGREIEGIDYEAHRENGRAPVENELPNRPQSDLSLS